MSDHPSKTPSLLETLDVMEASLRQEGDDATASALHALRRDVANSLDGLSADHAVFKEITETLLAVENQPGDAARQGAILARRRLLQLESHLDALGGVQLIGGADSSHEHATEQGDPAPSPDPVSVLDVLGCAGDEASDQAEYDKDADPAPPQATSLPEQETEVPRSTWDRTLAQAVGRAACADRADETSAAVSPIDQLVRVYDSELLRHSLAGVSITRVFTTAEAGAERQGAGVYVDLGEGGWLADEGRQMSVGVPDSVEGLSDEIATLVALAEAKGWSRVKLQGSDAFVQQAQMALVAAGFETDVPRGMRKGVKQPSPA